MMVSQEQIEPKTILMAHTMTPVTNVSEAAKPARELHRYGEELLHLSIKILLIS
jgi:hypothetical protein